MNEVMELRALDEAKANFNLDDGLALSPGFSISVTMRLDRGDVEV